MRKIHKGAFLKKHNIKLGFMSAFVKAAAQALTDQPAVNGGKTTRTWPTRFIFAQNVTSLCCVADEAKYYTFNISKLNPKLFSTTVIDDTTKEIVYRDYVDISVAVATPKVRL